ncbi:resolvase [Streptomyces sp. NPDC005774]|uniref:resolvase n=1 Tax=Streptomyces sp. NPDC005774 TaxID=3364728 RepID=UPI0036A9F96B
MPEHTTAGREDAPAPELPGTLDMPGKVAGFLRATEMGDAEPAALDHGVTVRRGQGYTLRVSAAPAVHRQFLARCRPLDGTQGAPTVPAQRGARREYENRVSALAPTEPWSSPTAVPTYQSRWALSLSQARTWSACLSGGKTG